MTVLVCTSPSRQDPYVARVVDALRERGVHACVVDGDRFPLDARVQVELGGPATLELPHDRVDLRAVSAVWLAHFDVGSALGDAVHEDFHEAVAAQGELALWDLLAACERALIVDRPAAVARVPLGTAQLALARASGLEVPRTLTSNEPEHVRRFAAECGGQIVTKLLHGSRIDSDNLDSLRLCPQLFQERVPKQLEIRVTVVGSRLLCAAAEGTSFVPYDLPESVARSILGLLDRLGLEFSTVDLILTPDGRHVFLEVNPVSYFGFIEHATGLPISGAIADLLSGRAEARLS